MNLSGLDNGIVLLGPTTMLAQPWWLGVFFDPGKEARSMAQIGSFVEPIKNIPPL